MRMIFKRSSEFLILPAFFFGVFAFFSGCAGEDPQFKQLSRQQAATIESLNAEVVRLNAEIDETIHAREMLRQAKDELAKRLADEISSGDLILVMEKRGLVIRFLESALFEAEKIELRNSAEVSLDKIADVLMGDLADNRVMLEGHTEGPLPAETGWKSSWEYTSTLASEVLHYFVDVRGLNPARFTVIACAEYQRVDARDTEDGRELNRRVEIVITPQNLKKSGKN